MPLVATLLAGCGYVGEPLPPALNIPSRVVDLRVVERGDKIILEFTIPELTTEGLVLKKLGRVDVRAGPVSGGPFNVERWAAQARPLSADGFQFGAARLETSTRDWVGQEISFGVRLWNASGRASDWSNLVALRVVPPLRRPVGLRAEAVGEGVRLTWQTAEERAGVAFRVYRRSEAQEAASPAGRAEGREWVDSHTQYGHRYQYLVQAVAKTGESEAESEISEPVEIVPEDRFPPAVPAGLTAVAGTQSIELAWERNTEPDFGGYRIYRSAGDLPFQRIADLLETPSYSDRNIEAGKRYRYAVSAVDQSGNESARSASVEIQVP